MRSLLPGALLAAQPIGLIPIEIYWHIFEHLSREWEDWAIVTQVCRYWRNAALDHSVLWENVSLPLGDLFFLVAERKQPRPRHLSVSVDISEVSWSLRRGTTRLLGDLHLPIRTFDVVATSDTFWQAWHAFDRIALDHLRVELRPKSDGVWECSGGYLGPTPRIKKLCITHCPLAWHFLNGASGLRELTLDEPTTRSRPPPPTISHIILVLEKQKTISRLVVNCTLDFVHDAVVHQVYAPWLEELVMLQDISDCHRFLQYIRLSHTATVDLSGATHMTVTNEVGRQEIAGYYSDIARKLGGQVHTCPIWSIEVKQEDHAIHVRACIRVRPNDSVSRCRIHFSVPVTATSATLTRACLDGIWDGLHLQNVSRVVISGRRISAEYTGGYDQLLNPLPKTMINTYTTDTPNHYMSVFTTR